MDKGMTDNTLRPDTKGGKTLRAGDTGKTLRPNNQAEIGKVLHQIKEQAATTDFVIHNTHYKVIKALSQGTGEADVYLVSSGNDRFALKLYRKEVKPDKNIIEIVHKNSGNPGLKFLVDTLRYGEWKNPKNGQSHYYELIVYCEGASLDQIKIKPNDKGAKLLGEIAIHCAACINFLHSKQVIHRDIKPANFFFRKKGDKVEELSLGDFGIAIQCDEKGEAKVTAQMRTKIYAAPEYYILIDKIAISKSMDFYSLGMMLLVLWEGGEDRYSAIEEIELLDLKQKNKLPYPEDMPERLLQLVRALTIADPEKRAGYDEIVKWANGKEIYNEESNKFKIYYEADKVANSPAELAKLMIADQEQATKYLYNGKIIEWLEKIHFNKLASYIREIVENRYPQKQEAGFWAVCYFLDPSLKYIDINNKAVEENTEIAAILKNNFGYYSQELADKDHRLFIYLKATGRGAVDKLISLFKKGKDNRDALLQLIYALDSSLPWVITDYDGNLLECRTTDDVLRYKNRELTENGFFISEQSDEDLVSESFLQWIGIRDKALEGKIRSVEGRDENIWAVLYNLNPKTSYELELDENSDTYFFTASEIGNYMNIQMEAYAKDEDPESYESSQLDMMCNIDNTQLYHYFKSKGGVYDDKIDWIRYCADVDSKDNANKAGPYNWEIGVYKSIKGLGYDPYYYFPKSDTYVYTLEELDDIPHNEIKAALGNRYLEAWLTTFFQEDPNLDLSPQFAYEEATDRYMQYLESLHKKHDDVVKYRSATNQVKNNLQKLNRKYKFNKLSKIILGALTLIATAAVVWGLLTLDVPTERDFHSSWIYIVSVAIGVIGTMFAFFDSNTDIGCIGALIGGAIWAVISYFALLFLEPYLVYVVSALLVTMLVLMAIRILKSPVSKGNNWDLFNPSMEELIVEPLNYVFRVEDGKPFRSSIETRTYTLLSEIGENIKTFIRKLIVPWMSILVFGIIAFGPSLNLFEGTFVSEAIEAISTQQKYASLEGEWKGIFDNRDAIISIFKARKKGVEAHISIIYKELTVETLKGTINTDTRIFHFDDMRNNGILDGEYNGTFNNDFTEFSGVYQDSSTKKEVKFKFSR